MTDLPIACTLTSDAMTHRLAFIEKLAQDGVIARESTDVVCVCACATPRTSSGARAS